MFKHFAMDKTEHDIQLNVKLTNLIEQITQ